jgi:hypothetical protein
MCVRERELRRFLEGLRMPPCLGQLFCYLLASSPGAMELSGGPPSRFSRALFSRLLPHSTLRLRGSNTGRQPERRIAKRIQLHPSTPCSNRGLPLDRTAARRLLRVATILSPAVGKDPARRCLRGQPGIRLSQIDEPRLGDCILMSTVAA